MLTSKKKGYRLSPETVDLLSQEFADSLTEAEADRKDILRLRLSLEEILEGWSSALPGAPVTFCAKKRLGRQRIEIRVEGKELQADDVLKNCLLSSRLLAQAGLTLTQSYQNGENCLTVEPPRKRKLGQMQKLLLAIVSAVVLGLLQRLLPAGRDRPALYADPKPAAHHLLADDLPGDLLGHFQHRRYDHDGEDREESDRPHCGAELPRQRGSDRLPFMAFPAGAVLGRRGAERILDHLSDHFGYRSLGYHLSVPER